MARMPTTSSDTPSTTSGASPTPIAASRQSGRRPVRNVADSDSPLRHINQAIRAKTRAASAVDTAITNLGLRAPSAVSAWIPTAARAAAASSWVG